MKIAKIRYYMSKKLILLLITSALLFIGLASIPSAKSRVQPYYNGEAFVFQGQVVFGTTNTGQFELFTVEKSRIIRKNTITSDDKKNSKFLDALFNEENGQLFLYLTNGVYLYKYRIVDFSAFDLIKKAKDNSGDFFYSLNKTNEAISTVGTKGVKAWNFDLQVIDSHSLHNTFADNIKYSQNGNYIYDIFKDSFKAIDAFYRYPVIEAAIRTREDHPRNIYGDDSAGAIYLVDDYSLVKFFFNGNFQKFDHISRLGYDVDGAVGSNYVYFSDGIGIVKMRKSDLKPVKWVYTEKIIPGQGGWSMGLRVVKDGGGEKTIVFNGNSILLFNDNLALLDYYTARESSEPVVPPLSLSLDKSRGAPGAQLSVRGGGFGPKEETEIKMGDYRFYAETDSRGFFTRIITIPEMSRGMTDIKATGADSNLTYSISFNVE